MRAKPTGEICTFNCSSRSVSFVASAADAASGVTSVKATVRISYRAKVGKKIRAKRATINRIERARSSFNTVWAGKFSLTQGIAQTVRMTLIVKDSAGNKDSFADAKEIKALGMSRR
jgi:hypothetical protein